LSRDRRGCVEDGQIRRRAGHGPIGIAHTHRQDLSVVGCGGRRGDIDGACGPGDVDAVPPPLVGHGDGAHGRHPEGRGLACANRLVHRLARDKRQRPLRGRHDIDQADVVPKLIRTCVDQRRAFVVLDAVHTARQREAIGPAISEVRGGAHDNLTCELAGHFAFDVCDRLDADRGPRGVGQGDCIRVHGRGNEPTLAALQIGPIRGKSGGKETRAQRAAVGNLVKRLVLVHTRGVGAGLGIEDEHVAGVSAIGSGRVGDQRPEPRLGQVETIHQMQ